MCHSLDLGHFPVINIWKGKKQKDHSKGFKRGIVPGSPRVNREDSAELQDRLIMQFLPSDVLTGRVCRLLFLKGSTLINKEGLLSVPVPQSSASESFFVFPALISILKDMKIISLTFKCSRFSASPEDTGLFLWKCHPNKRREAALMQFAVHLHVFGCVCVWCLWKTSF